MGSTRSHTWQDIQERIRSKIEDRTWLPGDLIPGEVTLAEQFGCARTTVNRALRELAATGVIDRKRKAGTRVAMNRARRVSAEIPVIRSQVEALGKLYRFEILENRSLVPPVTILKTMNLKAGRQALHLRSVHYADDAPYLYEDRWINTRTVAQIKKIDLAKTSANEWLVENVPFTNGEFVVEASLPGKAVQKALALSSNKPVLESRRTTWIAEKSVTTVALYYQPGFKLRFEI